MDNTLVKRDVVQKVLQTYRDAWVDQDSEKILTIFTPDATYHERPLCEPYRGHEDIAQYWKEKVVRGQSRIEFRLLNTYIDGSTVIAEWEASFDDLVRSVRKHIIEVAILEFRGDRIASLREYWASETVAQL